MMKLALELRSTRVAMAAAGALGLAMAAVPLLGVHGLESALVMGIALPPFAAIVGARLVAACRRRQRNTAALPLVGGAVGASLSILAVPAVVLALNSLRIRNCDPLQGLAFIALGPGFGVSLAAVAGVVIGAAVARPRLAATVAALLPVAGLALGIYEIYTTPAIFAYGHFFGHFHGSIYDEDISIPGAFLTFRAVTVVLAFALVAILLGCHDRTRHRLYLRLRDRQSLAWTLLSALALTHAAYAGAVGPRLGHRTTSAWIAEQLDARVDGRRCRVVVPRETSRAEARRLADDCDFRVTQMERWFGVAQKERVVAFFFRSPEEKRRLMGASRTYVAKPWRNEVYLQLDTWPHPVLAHEVAHVVAANVGSGPFRVAGRMGGYWPDPALIEGAAVAAAWKATQGMTPHQWARAMIETGLAPPLRKVLGAGFLGQQKRRAYVLAGSLIRFVAETRGSAAVRKTYRRGDIESALSMDIDELERRWKRFLKTVPLPEAARELARVRFAGGSILSSVCPHRVAVLKNELRADLSAVRDGDAIDTCREILDIDPADAATRARLVGSLARDGRRGDAERELRRLLGPPRAASPLIVAAREAVADAAWKVGNLSEASQTYQELQAEPLSDDAVRMLRVKTLALKTDARPRRLLFELLVGDDFKPVDGATAVHLARELRDFREDGLPHYLEARQLFYRQRFEHAARLLDEASQRGLPGPLFNHECTRLHAIARYATGEIDASRRLWMKIGRETDLARRVEATDFLQRIAYSEKR
jgi:hypothetical protein